MGFQVTCHIGHLLMTSSTYHQKNFFSHSHTLLLVQLNPPAIGPDNEGTFSRDVSELIGAYMEQTCHKSKAELSFVQLLQAAQSSVLGELITKSLVLVKKPPQIKLAVMCQMDAAISIRKIHVH